MKFTEQIKQLRKEHRMPQRQFAIDLEIDTATCCKIEKGERRVKAEQVAVIADMRQTGREGLLALWLADQAPVCIANNMEVADKAMGIVKKNIKNILSL